MKEKLILLADPVYGWETEKEYIWQDDAACAFQPHTLFEVAGMDSPIAQGLSEDELLDLNEENLKAGKKFCDTCPVWHLCYGSAREVDFAETMRAGILPTRMGAVLTGAYKAVADPCSEGHENWKYPANKARYCGTCKVEYNKARRAGEPGKGHKRTIIPGETRGVECKYGHDDWVFHADEVWRCKTCKRIRETDARRKKREAARVEG